MHLYSRVEVCPIFRVCTDTKVRGSTRELSQVVPCIERELVRNPSRSVYDPVRPAVLFDRERKESRIDCGCIYWGRSGNADVQGMNSTGTKEKEESQSGHDCADYCSTAQEYVKTLSFYTQLVPDNLGVLRGQGHIAIYHQC
jgi:hypothetical protein